MVDSIPVIDFSAYSLDREQADPETFPKLVEDVNRALSTIGFMYLKNYGISRETVDDVFAIGRDFFALPLEIKMKYARPRDTSHGYISNERERLNLERSFADLKEAFNYNPKGAILQPKDQLWPDDVLPEFHQKVEHFFDICMPLHNRILDVIGHGLKLKDPTVLSKAHQQMKSVKSITTLRLLYYPPLSDLTVHENQVRCGEHSDYGAITMLWQDEQGGLEVKNAEGRWIPACPIPGTFLVNIGDCLQRWTADKLVASKHRILLPPKEHPRWRNLRQSLAFFGQPDDEAIIECLDGSNKYPPISSYDYVKRILDAVYENPDVKTKN